MMITLCLFPESGDLPSMRFTDDAIPVLALGKSMPDIQFMPAEREFTLAYLQALAKAALGLAGEIERAQAERTEP